MIYPADRLRASVLLMALAFSQKPYFQQRVEYSIRVRLEPQTHTLHGYLRLRYQNNSPDTLPGLYFHLHPNAYSRRGTSFDRQQRIAGKSSFYFASREKRGYMDSLDFRVSGQVVKPLPARYGPLPAAGHSRAFLRRTPDVVWLPFPQPLPPGSSLEIETPFRVKVPLTFSRMGRSEVQYAITQWYPKPAVYDHKGWHPLPYLDQGEFYSEWGRYEVEIEVPENFLVVATGVLQNPEEISWLLQREADTRHWLKTLPADTSSLAKGRGIRFRRLSLLSTSRPVRQTVSLPNWAKDETPSPRYKTLRFVQDSVHDFAWFADPRYGLLSDTIALPNGHRVACVSVFHLAYYEAWQYAPRYIAEAIQKLSEWVGPYPYAHATAVEGGLEAGGGMEYPMITVIIPTTDTSALRQVVVHEVGHNWFQGLLGSNERLHPWQDEGINSYYENRIVLDSATFHTRGVVIRNFGGEKAFLHPEMVFYHHLNADIAPAAPSHRHSLISYGLGVYMKTALILRSAVLAFGRERWDAAMQRYFREWAFRHPYPEDWANVLEKEGLPGRALLGYLRTDKEIDLHLRFRRQQDTLYEVQIVELTAKLPRPFRVEALALDRRDSILRSYVLPLDSVQQVSLPAGTRLFLLNPYGYLYERRVGNNFFYARRLLPAWRQVRLALFAPLQLPQVHVTHVGIFPVLGYNYRDGLLVGAGIYHGTFPKRVGEFHLLPMYSLLQKDLRGSVGITFRGYPADSRFQLIEGHLRSASFAGFWHTKVSVEATLRRRYDTFSGRQVLRLRSYHLAFQNLESRAYTWVNQGRPAYIALDWEGRRDDPILTFAGMVSVGHDLTAHLRAEAEGRLYWRPLRSWHLWARGFAGWTANGAPHYLRFRASGFDPFGEIVLLDRFREGSSILLRQQMPETQGGARLPADTLIGTTLLAGNVEVPVLSWTFLRLRLDAGYLPQTARTYWGLSVALPVIRFKDRLVMGGYFPVLGEAFSGGRPTELQEVMRRFVWSIQIPLDARWALPW